jgi:hypothetical protein
MDMFSERMHICVQHFAFGTTKAVRGLLQNESFAAGHFLYFGAVFGCFCWV